MVHEAVAQRYASALFELRQGDKLLTELQSVEKTLATSPALARALQAPNVPDTVKKRIVIELFSQQHPYVLALLCLLVDKKREAYLPEIARQYRKMVEESQGITEAEVQTAVTMPEAVKANFKTTLAQKLGRGVRISWSVNPALIGGYVLRQGDRMLDLSIASRLTHLQHKLEGTTTWKKPGS